MTDQQKTSVLAQEPINGNTLRTYSGAPYEDFTAFREALESSFALGNVTKESCKKQILFSKLRGTAHIFYKENLLARASNASFEDIISAVKRQFNTDEVLMQRRNLFDRMQQRDQEAPNSFYQRLIVAAQDAEIDNTGNVIESRFKAGLQPRYANHCAKMGALTFAEFKKFAQALWNGESSSRADTVLDVFNAYRISNGERAIIHNSMPSNVITPATALMMNDWNRMELANLEQIQGPEHDRRLNRYLTEALNEGCSLAEAARHAARRAALPAFNEMYLNDRWPAPTARPPRQGYQPRPQYQGRRPQYQNRHPHYQDRRTQFQDSRPQQYAGERPRFEDRLPAPVTEANAEPIGPRLPHFNNKDLHPVYQNMALSCLQDIPGFDVNEYPYVARVTEEELHRRRTQRQQPILARAIERFPPDDQCRHPMRQTNLLRRRLQEEEEIRRQNREYENDSLVRRTVRKIILKRRAGRALTDTEHM